MSICILASRLCVQCSVLTLNNLLHMWDSERETTLSLFNTGLLQYTFRNIKEYNPSIYNFNVEIVDCSHMFRVLQNNHHQVVYEKCKKKRNWNNFPLMLLVCGQIMVTLEYPKHVTAVYDCYINFVYWWIVLFHYIF